MAITTSVETASEHPLGEAIVQEAKERKLRLIEPEEFEAIVGHGIEATVEGKKVYIGNLKLMREKNIDHEEAIKFAEKLAEQGKTPMYVAVDTICVGVVAVADPIKKDSVKAIKEMKKMGLEVVMITGDHFKTLLRSSIFLFDVKVIFSNDSIILKIDAIQPKLTKLRSKEEVNTIQIILLKT